MNKALLKKHIKSFVSSTKKHPEKYNEEYKERLDLISYYQAFTEEKILSMSEEEVFEYISKLWAMLMWGNKHYRVDKILEEHGLENFRRSLANLVWGEQDITNRWENFRKNIKGMGPAMMSEILCKTHPNDFILWSRRIFAGLNYLEVKDLPRYDYQLSGKVFRYLCNVCKEISKELKEAGAKDTNLLAVDYFIWELQKTKTEPPPIENSEFIHNDVRDKLRDIGEWLGFTAKIEQKVSEGSKVDTIWEATIGNMGRVI